MTRPCCLMIAVLAVMASRTAHAAAVTPPSGWTAGTEERREGRLGGAVAETRLEVYRAPASGAVLYVTWIQGVVPADRRDAVATAELDELRAVMRRAGTGAKAESSTLRADPANKLLEAALRWRDDTAGLVMSSRALAAADGQRLVVVRGECVLAADVQPAHAAACEAALATLDPRIAPDARVALALVEGGPAPASDSPGWTSERPPRPPTATLGESGRVVMPPIAITPSPAPAESDHRPVYVGGGIIVLAALFWWNRRRRERFDREERVEGGEPATEDADRDELHDAAQAAGGGEEDDEELKATTEHRPLNRSVGEEDLQATTEHKPLNRPAATAAPADGGEPGDDAAATAKDAHDR